ncbi:MAG: hypothetical protein HXX09_10840 [Bacteroidetes bacterium]|nr:hypothetical protein [Bacteroidota bacterium]
MKKLLLLICAILIIGNANAQEKKTEKDYKWSVGIQLNTPERKIPNIEDQSANGWDDGYLYNGESHNAITKDKTFALSLIGNYLLKDDNFLRCKVGFNNVDIKRLNDYRIDSLDNTISNAFKKRTDFGVAFGIGKSLEIKHLNLYAGFELPFTFYGKTKFYYYYQANDVQTGTPLTSQEISGTIFKAYSIGIGNFAGFTFKFSNFSIGGEISYAFLYSKRLSESTFQVINKDLQTNTVTSGLDGTSNPKISSFDMSKITGSITLKYSF